MPEAGNATDRTDAMGLGVGVDLAGEIILGPEKPVEGHVRRHRSG